MAKKDEKFKMTIKHESRTNYHKALAIKVKKCKFGVTYAKI